MSEAPDSLSTIKDFGQKTRTLAKALVKALIQIALRGRNREELPPGFQACQWASGNRSITVHVDTWKSLLSYLEHQSFMGYPSKDLPIESRRSRSFLPALKALAHLHLVSVSNWKAIEEFGKSSDGIRFDLINLPSWDKQNCADEIEARYKAYVKAQAKQLQSKQGDKESAQSPSSTPQPFFAHIRDDEAAPPPCYAPWPTAKKYVGRDHTLAELHEHLLDLQAGQLLSITAIGGEGKTELCRQYARRYLRHYTGGVFWFSGHEPTNSIRVSGDEAALEAEKEKQRLRTKLAIANRIIDCAKENGCPIEPLTPAERCSEAQLVLKLKRVWPYWNQRKSLFVYDNVIALDMDVLPPLDDPRFNVLVTTRISALGNVVTDFPLEPISDAAAVELLRAYIDERRYLREKSFADELVIFADKLPLGIELIGGYLDEPLNRLTSLEAVSKRLSEKRTDWSVIGDVIFDSPLSDEQQNISECYDMSWTQLRPSEKEAAYLIASNTTHTEIDTDFLYAQIRHEDDQEDSLELTTRTFNRLIKYNLIKHTVKDTENYVSYHRLMRDFVRFQMPEEVRAFLRKFWV
ncbi:MAG: hypothetical protein AAGA75_08880 [Cyanobacteria bacterium P01_E01_bin.6]